MQTFHFELLSPEHLLFSAEVESVVIPGREGELTALVGHAPFVSSLCVGVVSVSFSETREFFVKGGIVEVTPASVVILADEAFCLSDKGGSVMQEKLKWAEHQCKIAETEEAREEAQKILECLASR